MAVRTRVDLHEVSGLHRAALATVALVVALIAGGAFTLSFDALRALALLAGVRRDIAFLWPLIVDGFIFTATVAAVLIRPRGLRVSWYPWITLIVFAAISVAGNALHAADNATALDLTVAAAVSAVPAIALLLASHLLVIVLEGFRWNSPATGSANTKAPRPAADSMRAAGTSRYPIPHLADRTALPAPATGRNLPMGAGQ